MSTALYRRYRPETFADVIGQEHVTEPLMTAIQKARVNHAYLFSGPRGCGKTTSARILARCLNCAEGPTPIPCGICDSCVELARDGSGSLDVIEIDAASHGGVDDARDLRERATFAPVRDRYKIFIIDEAHMVTSAGFNALLKIVEEPPEHIKFIFATTEPDKVIGTIRSRTHHYPFRLVPPEPLMAYLELLCGQEDIPVAPGVLSLVVRAGGGSVRDSLSVLDQLMAGAGSTGIDYELAVSLLGYTHAALLDDIVDAFAAGDAATVFSAVDRVIQTGHDPRRFVEDLLERFRDLIIVNAVPEHAASILRGVPDDQLNRMRAQANQLGRGELSRAADITNTALTEMTGATSPRLHLELLCARILLPSADESEQGTLARVDRIERRLHYADGVQDRTQQQVQHSSTQQVSTEGQPATELRPSRQPAQPASTFDDAAQRDIRQVDREPQWESAEHAARQSPHEARHQPVEQHSSNLKAGQDSGTTGAPRADSEAKPEASLDTRSTATADSSRANSSPGDSPPTESSPADWGGSWGVSSGASLGNADSRDAQQAPAGRGEDSRKASGPEIDRSTRDESHTGPVNEAKLSSSEPVQSADVDQSADPAQSAEAPQPAQSGGAPPVEMVRRAWPEIMDELAKIKRTTWLNVNPDAKPRSLNGNQLILVFATQGNAIAFQRGAHIDNLRQAIHKVLGLECSIEAVHDGAASAGEADPKVPTSRQAPAKEQQAAPARANSLPRMPATQRSAEPARQAIPSTPDATATSNRSEATEAESGKPEPTRSNQAQQQPDQVESDQAAPVQSAQDPQQRAQHAPASAQSAEPMAEPARPTTPDSASALPLDTDAATARSAGSTPKAPVSVPEHAVSAQHQVTPTADHISGDDSWAAVEPPEEYDQGPESNRWQASAVPAQPGRPPSDAPVESNDRTQAADGTANRERPAQPHGTVETDRPAPSNGRTGPDRPALSNSRAFAAPAEQSINSPALPGKAPSRYQRLLDEAARNRTETSAAGNGTVDFRYVEDVPSADDETIEESGLVGRSAIERILNGRLIEERSVDGL